MAFTAKRNRGHRAKGTGCLYYDQAKATWNAQLDLGRNEQGKRVFKRFRRKKQEDVIAAMEEYKAKSFIGVPTDHAKQTLSQFLDHWLSETVKPHREPKTYRVYEQLVRLYIKPKLGHFALGKLNPQQIQSTFNQLAKNGGKADASGKGTPLAAKTVRDAKGVLCSALTSARRAGLIRDNPASHIATPKVAQGEAVYLSAQESATLIAATRGHYIGPLIEIALMTGLRLGEATGLTWDDIDLGTGTIRVRRQLQRVEGKLILKGLKTRSSSRTLSLPDEGVRALQEQRARQLLAAAEHKGSEPYNSMGLVFTSVHGSPLDGTYVDDLLKAQCLAAGVRAVSFHKLRHTAATHLASAGVPLIVVRDQLGHSQIGLTANLYSHAVPAALRQASDTLGDIYRAAETRNGQGSQS